MAELSGKLAWVLGGGSGVGKASAPALAEAGARVVVSGRRREPLDAVQALAPGAIHAVPLDVADSDAVAGAYAAIEAEHGPVDILVNSAGHNIAARRWAN